MTIVRKRFLMIGFALIGILSLTACGVTDPNSYTERPFPVEGEEAFKAYLNENATGATSFADFGDSVGYLIEWAVNGKKWREDLRGAWCLFTTSDIELKNGVASYKFVVYQSIEDEWGVNPSTNVYARVGC